MALPILFIFIDVSVYEFLCADYVIVDTIHLDLPDHFEMKVSGNGSIARLMNGVLDVFQLVQNALSKRNEHWRDCFKEPNPLDYGIVTLIFALFVICLILARIQIWMNRGTVMIANSLYGHRLRLRALHLYYEVKRILLRRLSLFHQILEHHHNFLPSIMQLKTSDWSKCCDEVVRRSMQSRGLFRVNCAKCAKADMRVADTRFEEKWD